DALRSPRSFARRLHGGQKEGDQYGDNRDYHQKLNQRKSAANPRRHNSVSENKENEWKEAKSRKTNLRGDEERFRSKTAERRRTWPRGSPARSSFFPDYLLEGLLGGPDLYCSAIIFSRSWTTFGSSVTCLPVSGLDSSQPHRS